MSSIDAYVEQIMAEEFADELKQLVAIPSISSDPEYKGSILECASYLERRLKDLGAKPELVETAGYPLLVARIENDPSMPTVAIYNHYDVQPIAEPDKWESDPFILSISDGKYFGRGASDDKGNLVVALKAVELALKENLPLNFELIYEGEEEKGSPNFKEGIDKVREFLKPDSIVVADGGWLSRERPSIEYGLRGLLYMHWNLKTGEKGAHSGSVGGAARNPLEELMEAVSKCHNPRSGEILIPGIYDKVREPKDEEIQHWVDSGFDPDAFMKAHRLKDLRVRDKVALLRTIWAQPTFEVHGCIGGYMKKDGRMTVVPPAGQLLVSMRLVADQDPDEVFDLVTRYLAKLNPEIEVKKVSAAKPYLGEFDSREINAASRALEESFSLPVSKIRSGGSIGAVVEMYEALNHPPILIMAFSLPEHGVHGPNEYFDKRQAQGGIKTFFHYFKSISATSESRYWEH